MSVLTAAAPARRAQTSGPRPLRICFLIDELATAGTETQLLALIRHLDRQRFTPYLCLLRAGGPISIALEPDDCPVMHLGVGSLCRPAAMMEVVALRALAAPGTDRRVAGLLPG